MAIESSLTKQSTTDYGALFRLGIIRSAKYLLTRLEQITIGLPIEEQNRARHNLSYALKLDSAWPVTRKLLLTLAPKMEQAGARSEWMAYLERGQEQSRHMGDIEMEAELQFHLGVLYQYQAEYDLARRQFEWSALHFERLGNQHHQARALNRLAGAAQRQHRFSEATELVHRALTLLTEEKVELGYSYYILGIIALARRDWEQAHQLLNKSLDYWQGTNEPRLIAWGLTNLSTVLRVEEKYDEAIAYYQRAITLFERIDDPVHLARARMNLGNVYLKLECVASALELYLLAEVTFRKTTDRLQLAMINNNKGMAYHKLQQFDHAKQAYQISIETWQQIGNMRGCVNTMDNLGLLYLEQGLYDEAIAVFQNAQKKLVQIKGEPSTDHLFAMVNKNLRSAMERRA
jgi:tetratricopeptide (TPR) repeat protein